MKKSQLDELIRLITRQVLKEFMNIDPASNSDIHADSSSTAPNAAQKSDKSKSMDDADPIDHEKDVEQGLKDLDYKRKAKEADYTRNVKMAQQYRQVERPALLKQRQYLQKQLRSI